MFIREAFLIPVSVARQYGDAAALARRRLGALNELLAYCVRQVPYYRDDPRYDVPQLRDLDDLATLPVLNKQVLRERPLADMTADGVDPARCLRFQTSGSTGQRVTILHDQASHDYHMAACVRRFLATGRYLPTHRLSHIRPFAPPSRTFERFNLFRRHVILSHLPPEEIKAALLADRPEVLIGYPVHLRGLLRTLTDDELAQLRRHLRMVMTESELLLPEHRAEFAERFGVPVFDEYSAFEVLNIYYECRLGGRHLGEDRIHVEILDEQGRPVPDGVEGRVTVTAFMERAMPLLRYDLGDVGVIDKDPCPCGRRFRTLTLTKGRVNDFVVLPNGHRLYPDAFLHLAAVQPGVSECFVRQDAAGLVTVHIVPQPGSREKVADVLDGVRATLFGLAGGEFPLELVVTDQVEITVGGKGRFVSSELSSGATG